MMKISLRVSLAEIRFTSSSSTLVLQVRVKLLLHNKGLFTLNQFKETLINYIVYNQFGYNDD